MSFSKVNTGMKGLYFACFNSHHTVVSNQRIKITLWTPTRGGTPHTRVWVMGVMVVFVYDV